MCPELLTQNWSHAGVSVVYFSLLFFDYSCQRYGSEKKNKMGGGGQVD